MFRVSFLIPSGVLPCGEARCVIVTGLTLHGCEAEDVLLRVGEVSIQLAGSGGRQAVLIYSYGINLSSL